MFNPDFRADIYYVRHPQIMKVKGILNLTDDRLGRDRWTATYNGEFLGNFETFEEAHMAQLSFKRSLNQGMWI